jgi:hypothetical protein
MGNARQKPPFRCYPPKAGPHRRTKVRDEFFMDHFKILQKKL